MKRTTRLTASGRRALLAMTSVAGLSVLAAPALAQPAQAPLTRSPLTQADVRPSPIYAIPDAGPGEALDGAAALGDSVSPAASTLNAQMAALQRSGVETAIQRPVTSAPTVAVARRVMDAAAAFDSYVHKAAAITPDVHEGGDVAKAVLAGAAYEPHQLQEGAIAYAALAALQSPRFVQGVSDLGQDPVVRQELVRRLLANPETALQLTGAREAGALVVSVMGRIGESVVAAGAAVKQAAYTVQHQEWSKAPIEGPEALLAGVKTQSATKIVLAPADAPALIGNVVAAGKLGAADQARLLAPTATVARGLALAALAVLGAAGDESVDQLTPVLSEPTSAQCLKMAKLNLYQCLAVAGPHYEGLFCLGRHGLMDTGQCVVTSVAWPGAAPSAPPSRSILVPIALASLSGPERDSVMGAGPASGSPAADAPEPMSTPPLRAEAALDYAPPQVAAPRPAASVTLAMATLPGQGEGLTAPSRWRPNGPEPGDRFVGGPLGYSQAGASPAGPGRAALAYDRGGYSAPQPTYGYGPPPQAGYGYGPPSQ
jgi:hypothetical protein